jgi:chaperone modulatory protein CbpM
MVLVSEGVLEPIGGEPKQWRFGAEAGPRARRALRLQRDLELDASAVALVLDLLDRIEALESQLRRLDRA